MEEGLEQFINEKGRAVRATRNFAAKDFIVEYRGDLIERSEAKEREKLYCKDKNIGSFMFHFRFNDRRLCIDATAESRYLGRIVNHSTSKHANSLAKLFKLNGKPHIIIVAARDIYAGEEICYDYNETNREAINCNPWLKPS